jgi:uncharacterized Fe-S cluster protein YjdI
MINDTVLRNEQLDFEAHLQNPWIQGDKPQKHETYHVYGECLSGAGNTEGEDFEM